MRLIDVDKIYQKLPFCNLKDEIENAPTVEAIPIAWIEMFMKKYWHIGDSEHKVLNFMVIEWRKENEQGKV